MGYLRPTFAWLEITGLCNENCRHCYAGSSPQGDHGSMTVADWRRVVGELRGMGVRNVQFIGGCSRGRRVPRRSCRFRLGRRGPVVLP
ncbi:radical SAM protein [Streptomyces niveus]|uniref:radical SAM protein n=1 Tax=Streptomyces niveus TaxID=193462 RepID=UPI0036CEFE29